MQSSTVIAAFPSARTRISAGRLFAPVFALAVALLLSVPGTKAHAQSTAVSAPAAAAPSPADAGLQALVSSRLQAIAAPIEAREHRRIEISVGTLDPRLRLAPCDRIEPFLPPGTRPWGRIRVGVRCAQGPVAWNVYLPVQVRVFGAAVVAAQPLPAGSTIEAGQLAVAEVDVAESPAPTFVDPQELVGRTLARNLSPGEALRSDSLRVRQWFGAGDQVKLVAMGSGFAVSGEGEALSPGLDGQRVRVRTESGRIVTGVAVGERRVEVAL